MTETAYERVIGALRGHGCKVVERGGQRASATCPHHEDRNPSVSITGITGQALVYCHAGCDSGDVLGALGLTMADLYDERSATYRYDDGRTVRRYYDDQGKKQFSQRKAGPTSTLYRLAQLQTVPPGRTVFLVEGEKDVHAIEAAGAVATTAPQGADSFHKVDIEPLRDHSVAVVVDHDGAGDGWAAQVAEKLEGVAGRYWFVRAAEGKDAADHIAAGHGLTDFEPYVLPAASPPRPLYGDVAALLAGGIPSPPTPVLLRRDDGNALFYASKVNVLFGDPECGKTWIALAAVVEALQGGRRAVFVDLDHNGMPEVVSRLLLLGAKPADLGDLEVFRYAEPEDAEEMIATVVDLRQWRPAVAVVDSIGELLPLLGLSSNSPDDYTEANARTLKPLAKAGAAVIVIDHLPKDDAAREKGQTGTLAKRRTVNGVTLRVTVAEPFVKGVGGAASMTVTKDRPGGVREHCPPGRTPPAGRFVMTAATDGMATWHVTAPSVALPDASDDDVAELDSLDPPPKSQRDVQERCGWGGTRALSALRMWRELRKPEGS